MDVERARAVLEGLDPEQRQAVLAPAGPVRIIAGAGTGKTRTITHRIAYQVHSGAFTAPQTMAVTHSRKAAGELRERLANLGVPRVQASTFHSAALRQLRYFWPATGLPGTGPNLLTDRRSLIRGACAAVTHVHPGQVASETVLTVDAEITWAHAQLVSPAQYQARARTAGRVPDVDPAVVAAAYQAYEDAKRERNVLDFDDLLVFTTQLLRRDASVAAAFAAGYCNFVVDEYQDTDPAQQALLEAWLGDRDTLTAVGDVSQTVFSFKGADPGLLLGFTDRWPNGVSVALVNNYRSTPQVVGAANRIARRLAGSVQLRTENSAGPEPAVIGFADEASEASGVATLVRDAIAAGTAASEVAVLHRYNSQAPALRAALVDAGVAISVRSEEEFFTRREISWPVRQLHQAAAADPTDDAAAVALEVLDAAGFDENDPPVGIGAARERWENQAALLDQVRTLAAAGTTRIGDVVAELDRRAAAEHVPSGANGVTVTTIHKAKGLEWDVVVVARTTDGSLPSALATTSAEKAEEQRLGYVAVTRARTRLYLTWARTWGKNKAPASPSPFHALVSPTGTGRSASHRTAHQAQSPRAARADLAAFSVGDRVTHDTHGLGRVTAVAPDHVDVDFGGPRSVRVRGGEPLQSL